jgi:hypothetical protein
MNEGIGIFMLILLVVVVPIMIVGGAEVLKRYIAYRERKLELMADRTAERAAQYAAQVERLETRMRVLERIATDRGVDVATQIEALREEELSSGSKEGQSLQ